jgi:hypothetical protein
VPRPRALFHDGLILSNVWAQYIGQVAIYLGQVAWPIRRSVGLLRCTGVACAQRSSKNAVKANFGE